MFEEYATIKILNEILKNPEKKYTLRGLAKNSKTSKNSTAKAIKFMLERKIITKKIIGPSHQYQTNTENPITKQWKIIFNLEEINKSKIVDEIKIKIPSVECILLYGSMAKGTNKKNSDIDLLVINAKKIKTNIENKLKNELNLMIITKKDWRQMSKTNKAFYDSVILDSIVLFGRKPVIL
jgi:predicted nucleotidyltransferase